jgi:hypothetical protein
VQYTFTHKQYIEQHSETENTERNIHNNKNILLRQVITKSSAQITSYNKVLFHRNLAQFSSFHELILIPIFGFRDVEVLPFNTKTKQIMKSAQPYIQRMVGIM